jgi:hypothetical protein
VSFVKYIKAAFLNPWNLLAFGGGMAFAVLSGPFALPLGAIVLAAELAYLGLLGTHPKFQRYIDAQEAKAARDKGTKTAETTVQRILDALPDHAVDRYEGLRARCLELRQIAQAIKNPQEAGEPMPLDALQLAGLDRLLWMFLRLLYTQHSLERFLAKTSPKQIEQHIKNLETQLTALPPAGADPQKERIRKSLEDNLATSRARLDNYTKAHDHGELVKLELDRLENKIRSLSELAVNRHETDFIASQVDDVVSGMVQTERTIGELQFATGLETQEEVPQLLQRPSVQVKG